jgi:hypothetical protein
MPLKIHKKDKQRSIKHYIENYFALMIFVHGNVHYYTINDFG